MSPKDASLIARSYLDASRISVKGHVRRSVRWWVILLSNFVKNGFSKVLNTFFHEMIDRFSQLIVRSITALSYLQRIRGRRIRHPIL